MSEVTVNNKLKLGVKSIGFQKGGIIIIFFFSKLALPDNHLLDTLYTYVDIT
jgi:hypothetical protein